MKYLYLLFSLALLLSCNKKFQDTPVEDYDKLFPFTGIEKPKPQVGEAIIRQGDPRLTAKTFVYQGIVPQFFETEYKVKIHYLMHEDYDPNDDAIKSRYSVRFVDENKQLISVGSNPDYRYRTEDELPEDGDYESLPEREYEMANDEGYTFEFTAKSGFQMLLCVNGTGPTKSWISATITATATDGSVEPIILSTKQVQVNEGIALIPHPYCKYVVLP